MATPDREHESKLDDRAVDTARVLAFTSLSMIPALIFFSLFERRIVGACIARLRGDRAVGGRGCAGAAAIHAGDVVRDLDAQDQVSIGILREDYFVN